MNVMLLSISLWAGADSDANSATRDLFHWLSALVALPTSAYAGQPFFESAARALRARSVNMDVPISLGVILALGMSMLQTLPHERVAYFDSALMLLMFLLAGRYLDQRMRRRTRDFAVNLSAIRADRALKLFEDGEARETPIAAIQPGDLVLVRAGERIAVDGAVEDGRSEIDQSLVTGETAPVTVSPGALVYAGTLNLGGALRVRVRAAAGGTFLDEVNGLLENAVEQRSSYVRLADRAARLYAPLVHAAALATFVGWLALGAGWQNALLVAITVLIITCPCAFGLAVPAVQAIAAGTLFRHGLILHSGEALERLAEVDAVVFDKTGTLTQPRPVLANAADVAPDDLRLAGSLALSSRHPLARAIVEAAGAKEAIAGEEFPGQGVGAVWRGEAVRLGSVAWCGAEAEAAPVAAAWPDASLIALRTPERAVVFAIRQALRPDAAAVVAEISQRRDVEILSGDRKTAVALVARELGVSRYEVGAATRRQDRAAQGARERRPSGAHGRGRPQRRAGAGGGACLDLAGVGRPYRPGAGRCAVPGRAARAGRRRVAHRSQGAPADGRESLAFGDLQWDCGAGGGARSCDASHCGAGDVWLLHPGDAECGARARGAGEALMNVLVYLVPLALALGGIGLAAFLWALKSGQFDDLDGAAWRAISDDDLPEDKR